MDLLRTMEAYAQGRQQGALAEERYHYLCAAIQGAYALTAPTAMGRVGIRFGAYTAYALPPLEHVKLHPRPDGSVHPDDLAAYVQGFRGDWKCREGGVLYCLAEARPFWNMVLHWHAAGTTGYKPWDRLFRALRAGGFDRGLVPCMVRCLFSCVRCGACSCGVLKYVQFFAREAGCMIPECPFKHDKDACVRDRAKVLAKRRVTLGKPTPRAIHLRERRAVHEYQSAQRQVVRAADVASWDPEDEDDFDPELDKIFAESLKVRAICSNPACLAAKMRKGEQMSDEEPAKMMRCSRCTVATYCSVSDLALVW